MTDRMLKELINDAKNIAKQLPDDILIGEIKRRLARAWEIEKHPECIMLRYNVKNQAYPEGDFDPKNWEDVTLGLQEE